MLLKNGPAPALWEIMHHGADVQYSPFETDKAWHMFFPSVFSSTMGFLTMAGVMR